MSELAETYLRQARSFLLAGEPDRSVDLLKKARALSAKNPQILVTVLRDLVNACKLAGRVEEAGRFYLQLRALVGPDGGDISAIAEAGRGQWRSRLVAVCAMLLLVGFAVTASWWVAKHAGQNVVNTGTAPATEASVNLSPREQLLRDSVGIVFVIDQYAGEVDGRHVTVDRVLPDGSCFAIRSDGYLLTNRHVAVPDFEAPTTYGYEDLNIPPLNFVRRRFVVCFGSNPADHLVAQVEGVSSTSVDMAVLHVDRHFRHPLTFAKEPNHQGDDVFVAGFPGAVVLMISGSNLDQNKTMVWIRQSQASEYFDEMKLYDSQVFTPQLNKGIVSISRRVIDNVAYLQFDGVVSGGNSGGPLLDTSNHVLGMTTLEVADPNAKGNDFAISAEELKHQLPLLLPAR